MIVDNLWEGLLLVIHAIHGVIGLAIRSKSHKAKTSAAIRITILDNYLRC